MARKKPKPGTFEDPQFAAWFQRRGYRLKEIEDRWREERDRRQPTCAFQQGDWRCQNPPKWDGTYCTAHARAGEVENRLRREVEKWELEAQTARLARKPPPEDDLFDAARYLLGAPAMVNPAMASSISGYVPRGTLKNNLKNSVGGYDTLRDYYDGIFNRRRYRVEFPCHRTTIEFDDDGDVDPLNVRCPVCGKTSDGREPRRAAAPRRAVSKPIAPGQRKVTLEKKEE